MIARIFSMIFVVITVSGYGYYCKVTNMPTWPDILIRAGIWLVIWISVEVYGYVKGVVKNGKEM